MVQPNTTNLVKANIAPEITLVVCTRNRAERLQPFFDALWKIRTDHVWELIIVDNGSTDQTSEYLQTFAAKFPVPVTLINDPGIGLGLVRNRGWRAASAPIIAFTDDDCYPDKDFLDDIKASFDDSSLGVIGGRILLFDPTDVRMTINESLVKKILQPGEFIFVGFLQGANMAFRRQALVDINGFDPDFGPGTPFVCEDADVTLRVLAAGWKGKYDPRPLVYHHHRRKTEAEITSLLKTYDAGRGACHMKCLLYMPQRWQCAWHWLKSIIIRGQSVTQTRREIQAAIRYLVIQLKGKSKSSWISDSK